MNFHGCHHQFRRPREYDEPPLPASSQYSDQSTTTDGLYASIRPSNITNVGPASFDDFSEDDNSHEEQHTSHFHGKLKRLRFYLMVMFIMWCLQMLAIVVVGAVIHLHRHDGGKASTGETTALLSKPIDMIQSLDLENEYGGPANMCAPGSDIRNQIGNCTIFQVLKWLVDNSEKKEQATMEEVNKSNSTVDSLNKVLNGLLGNISSLATHSHLQERGMDNITRKLNNLARELYDVQTSRNSDAPLTLAHLRGEVENNTLTWKEDVELILKGDVRYDTYRRCLTVQRE
ncbi:uncharacterized protein LOC106163125, partial [Lingula anatina]|uniref:Uncharacterized protein LOC106163125 n=1 Tax=Lingula anatina TaxID=7574 RepID=A0A1S3ICX7_LINAN